MRGMLGKLSLTARVDLTGGYCWSFPFHATRLLVRRWILEIFRPSTTTYAKHYFRYVGDDQQYPGDVIEQSSRCSQSATITLSAHLFDIISVITTGAFGWTSLGHVRPPPVPYQGMPCRLSTSAPTSCQTVRPMAWNLYPQQRQQEVAADTRGT